MATMRTAGKTQIATQITTELLERFRRYAADRGETFSTAIERAMTREMAYPPPLPAAAPLPDAAPPAPKQGKGKKGGAK